MPIFPTPSDLRVLSLSCRTPHFLLPRSQGQSGCWLCCGIMHQPHSRTHPPSSETWKKGPPVCHVSLKSLSAPPHCCLSTVLMPLPGNVVPKGLSASVPLPQTKVFHLWKNEAIKAVVDRECLPVSFTGQKLQVT